MTCLRASLVVVALLGLGSPSLASEWSVTTFDDGVWFQAEATSGALKVACGGRSSYALPAEQSQVADPIRTQRGNVLVSIAVDADAQAQNLKQLEVAVGGRVQSLGPMDWNARARRLELELPYDADFLRAIRSAARVELNVTASVSLDVSGDGAAEALDEIIAFCAQHRVVQQSGNADALLQDKVNAFASSRSLDPAPVVQTLDFVDLNGDGMVEALLILGGTNCGARYCDGFALDLSGETARELGAWFVATLRAAPSKLNGWIDIEVNGALSRFNGERYD